MVVKVWDQIDIDTGLNSFFSVRKWIQKQSNADIKLSLSFEFNRDPSQGNGSIHIWGRTLQLNLI